MKKLFVIILSLLIPLLSYSSNITKEQAKQYALTAFQQRVNGAQQHQLFSNISIKTIDYVVEQGDTLMAIFNFQPQGFLILSMKETTYPVLGYSLKNEFDMNNLAPEAGYLLETYAGEMLHIQKTKAEVGTSVKQAWQDLKAKDGKSVAGVPVISPLTYSKWGQGKYYNQLCPIVKADGMVDYDDRAPNGCVALTMAILMYYYRYPETGVGSNSYTPKNANLVIDGPLSVDFSEQHYNYDVMQDQLTSFNYEMAKLIYHCGVSVNMDYKPSGSGAHNSIARNALVNNFQFSEDAVVIEKSEKPEGEWKGMLMAELDLLRPIYYFGRRTATSGHVFICDGYDSDSLFHFDFGWDGRQAGFYSTTSSDDNAVNGYYSGQGALFNVYPKNDYPTYCVGTKLITATKGTLEDGSNIQNYLNDSECTYIIAPPDANRFTITIEYLSTEENHDSLSFWKGNPDNRDLVASYSGNLSNHKFNVDTDSLYITFKSNDSITAAGWRLTYEVRQEIYPCVGINILNQQSGTFNDGSAEGQFYASNTDCSWNIRPTPTAGVENITLKYDMFDIAAGDYFTISNSDGVVLDTYDEYNLPPAEKTYEGIRIIVNFRTDNQHEKDGFTISWHTNLVNAVNEVNSGGNVAVYPNPANEQFYIDFSNETASTWDITLCDITGKVLFKDVFHSDYSSLYKVNTSDLSTGIYFIKLASEKAVYTKKIVIQK